MHKHIYSISPFTQNNEKEKQHNSHTFTTRDDRIFMFQCIYFIFNVSQPMCTQTYILLNLNYALTTLWQWIFVNTEFKAIKIKNRNTPSKCTCTLNSLPMRMIFHDWNGTQKRIATYIFNLHFVSHRRKEIKHVFDNEPIAILNLLLDWIIVYLYPIRNWITIFVFLFIGLSIACGMQFVAVSQTHSLET